MRRTKAQLAVAAALMAEPDDRHYGYPLSRAAKVRSGVLYPLLTRWEGIGLLASEWDVPDPQNPGRPRRRYYTVTSAGHDALTELLGGRMTDGPTS